MAFVQVGDKSFRLYLSKETIQNRITELGKQIENDHSGLNPLFIGILNGSFIFAADLLRSISVPAEISFVKLTSYSGTSSTGNVATAIGLKEDLQDRHVIIVEDIIDTGKTLHTFLPGLLELKPASLKLACLLSKPDALQHDINIDYTGFSIPDNFVVGYGLDYNGYGRNLPDIYTLADQ